MTRAATADHDIRTVRRVMRRLSEAGAACWLFGGWAEELRGLRDARAHGDIDLLHVAEDFGAVDDLLRDGGLVEIEAKRFPHKRAFRFEGVMVELFFVETDARGRFTSFWGKARYDWPPDAFSLPFCGDIPVASVSALIGYRRSHDRWLARG